MRTAFSSEKFSTTCFLLLLTLAALLVHGYHPFAEDAEIYLPGIEKILDPQLFPVRTEFFESHAHLTLFPNLIAWSVRIAHLPLPVVLSLWHLASIFLLLLACWQVTGRCFSQAAARWAGIAMVAALLTLPVAGTALYIMDQYVVNRNLAAFAGMFAVAATLGGRSVRAGLWLVFALVIHPLMAIFALCYCALLVALQCRGIGGRTLAWLLPVGFLFPPASEAYREASLRHGFQYLNRWSWYEWLGIIAPIVLFLWFGRVARARQMAILERVCLALVIYGLVFFAAALLLMPRSLETLARLQPLRSLHLLYMLLLVVGGGLLGQYVLKDKIWRWLVLFAPLALGMFLVQRALFPSSSHVEWPWARPENPWAQAFVWVRATTPRDALFALDPEYMAIPGEDAIGFRALAERSRLADAVKDSGAVSMFPPLAEEWSREVHALGSWKNFEAAEFRKLDRTYGVNWVVLQQPGVAGLDCPYRNRAVVVCRVE